MTEPKITFREICELEPGVERLYCLAKMIGRRRGQRFCANALWTLFFKPCVVRLVGWERRPSMPGDFKFIQAKDLLSAEVPEAPANPTIPMWASASSDPRLKTSAAYSIAYGAIYDALPDCNHDGLCWG